MQWVRRSRTAAPPHPSLLPRLQRAGESHVAIVFAVVSIALVGAIGLAIDYSRLTLARTELQNRLDAALLAGASVPTAPVATAETVFDNAPTGTITKPRARAFRASRDGLTGTASAAVPTTLAALLGIRSFDVSASGKAVATGGAAVLAR